MAIKSFPPVEQANEHGLLAVGGDLGVESLLLAYTSGIFPWPIQEEYLTWFSPDPRTVLFLKDFHISKSLKKELKQKEFEFKIDHDCKTVIRECAESENRNNQDGTWITDEMIDAYINFHKAGYCHSVETHLDKQTYRWTLWCIYWWYVRWRIYVL